MKRTDELQPPQDGLRRRAISPGSALVAVIPALAIVIASIGLFLVNNTQNAADAAVEHADEVQVSSAQTLMLIVDAETGMRGYAATGAASFLVPYDRAVTELPASMSKLTRLAAGVSSQARRVLAVGRSAASELDTLARLREEVAVGARRDNRFLITLITAGEQTMKAIRGQVTAIETSARNVQEARSAGDRNFGRLALGITVGVGVVGGAGGLLSAWMLGLSEEARRRVERERAAQVLQASEDDRSHNELLLASTTEGIATMSPDGRCTSMNLRGARMLGYEPEEMVGRDMHELIHGRHGDGSVYPADSCKIMLAVTSGAVCRIDGEVFWRKDGTRLPVEYSAAPLNDDGVSRGAVVTFVDVSERRAFDADVELQAAELRTAIAHGELVLHYQPKIAIADGAIIGVEALVRWRHPGRGLVFPDEFIPLAAATGVMSDLTTFVLEAAVAQHASWLARGIELPVAVNLSVESLVDPALPDRLERLCRRYGVGTDALELEVTESGVMTEPQLAIRVLEALAAKGFALAIDDFGTGFSSLAYLRSLPVSVVKIDKSFVRGIPESEPDSHIVRGTIDLVHGLGKYVVAEGVETGAALEFLRAVGCNAGQGYHWSRPLPEEELVAWLGDHPEHRIAGPAKVA